MTPSPPPPPLAGNTSAAGPDRGHLSRGPFPVQTHPYARPTKVPSHAGGQKPLSDANEATPQRAAAVEASANLAKPQSASATMESEDEELPVAEKKHLVSKKATQEGARFADAEGLAPGKKEEYMQLILSAPGIRERDMRVSCTAKSNFLTLPHVSLPLDIDGHQHACKWSPNMERRTPVPLLLYQSHQERSSRSPLRRIALHRIRHNQFHEMHPMRDVQELL